MAITINHDRENLEKMSKEIWETLEEIQELTTTISNYNGLK